MNLTPWQPNRWGKGYLTNSGKLVTWTVGDRSADPHHYEVEAQTGDKAAIQLWINPAGAVTSSPTFTDEALLRKSHPALHIAEDIEAFDREFEMKFAGYQPTQTRMWLPEDGTLPTSPEEMEQLQKADYTSCFNPRCDFHISPEAYQSATNADGWYTCPNCQQQYNLLAELPFSGEMFAPGGTTRVGLSMRDQGQIGENLVKNLNEIPGYGPITWWSEDYNSPLDGGTKDWGIEVKTINNDSLHHRFIPGRKYEKDKKNQQAAEMGYKGILGVLVVLDYRRSVADLYVREMPLKPWRTEGGQMREGVAAFRKHNARELKTGHQFENPFLDPSDTSPHLATTSAFADDDIPF